MLDIIILISLLALGYGFGSYREKQHYRSIFKRETEFQDIMLFDVRSSTKPETDVGGELVIGNVVVSVDYFKRFVASLRKLVGGRLRSYETLVDRGRREAVLRMKQHAQQLGANQILNVKFETSSISKGAEGNIGSIEVLVYGSAVKT
jgi:uncharacterized protein YbjQ (UPF0145 family)